MVIRLNEDVFNKLTNVGYTGLNSEIQGITEKAMQNHRAMLDSVKSQQEKVEQREEWKIEIGRQQLQYLSEIVENTAYMKSIVELLSTANKFHQENNEILKEIFDIATSKNQEEATSKFNKITGKLADLTSIGANTIAMYPIAQSILTLTMQNLDKIHI